MKTVRIRAVFDSVWMIEQLLYESRLGLQNYAGWGPQHWPPTDHLGYVGRWLCLDLWTRTAQRERGETP